MTLTRKRKLLVAGSLATAAAIVVAVVAVLAIRRGTQPTIERIGSEDSKSGKQVTGVGVPVVASLPEDIFDQPEWPRSSATTQPLSVRRYQVCDFKFFRIGDDNFPAVGYGWFDDGKKFWWAQKNGLLRSATFPDLEPLREISFGEYRIHKIRPRPWRENGEPWRKTERELAELDFRGAVGVGSRVIAMFGAPGYAETNLVEIELPSMEVVSASRLPGFFYDIMNMEQQTIALKGDRQLGFFDVATGRAVVHGLASHRGVRQDDSGLFINIRDNETYTLKQSEKRVALKHRSDLSTWSVRSSSGTSQFNVRVDARNRVVTVRNGEQLTGFADGFNFLNPRFHPRGDVGLASTSGVGTRMPGFGVLALTDSPPMPKGVVEKRVPNPSTTNQLPDVTTRRLNSRVQTELASQDGFAVTAMKLQPVVGHVPANADNVIFDESKLFFDSRTAKTNSIVCLNLDDESIDFVIDDARLCAVTENYLVIETQNRFLVLERASLKAIRDLQFSASARFAKGHYGDMMIVDSFDSIASPAAIDAATGERLVYFPRFGAASSVEQRQKQDSRWFGDDGKNLRRRFAGLAVIPASGRKLLEIAPSGQWAFSRFGPVKLTWESEWPVVQHSQVAEMPRSFDAEDPDLLTEQISRDSKLAMLPDSSGKRSAGKFIGMALSWHDKKSPPIQFVTDHAQVWMDQNPATGNFWIRVREPASVENDFRPVVRMVEFDSRGTRLRTLIDFCSVAQHRRFMQDGSMLCWGDGRLLRVNMDDVPISPDGASPSRKDSQIE